MEEQKKQSKLWIYFAFILGVGLILGGAAYYIIANSSP